MTEMLLDGLRHLLTLLFGIGVSAAFLDVAPTRKNIVILSVFSALDFIVLCILFLLQSDSVTYAFYPLLTHMPLVLLFTLAFKCRLAPSVLAVLTAYLCCQISNWISTIPQTFHCPDWSVDITYIIVLIIISPLVWKYVGSFTDRKASVQADILPYFLWYRACILLYLRLCFHRIHEAAVCRESYYSRIPAVFAVYFLFDFLRDLL